MKDVLLWHDGRKAISANVSVTCYIQAHDLEHSRAIDDPVTGFDPGSKKIRGKISGDLPWDRYYGNYVSVKIGQDKDSIQTTPIIKLNIPVRVIHIVRLDDKLKRDVDRLNNEKINEVVIKMLSQ